MARLAGRGTMACVLALALLAAPWAGQPVSAAPPIGGVEQAGARAAECDATPDDPCPLTAEAPATAMLAGPGDVHAYRVFVLDTGARVRLELADVPAGTRLRLLGWGARPLGEATAADGGSVRLDVEPREAGAYVVEVEAGEEISENPYALALDLAYAGPVPRAVTLVHPSVESNAPGGAVEGRYTLQTVRGGSPSAGLTLARGLRTSPEIDLADFTLVTDVRFDQADGPAAATVRFRYQPEAGGGTGYLVSVDPFSGEVSFEAFDEAQRRRLAPPTMHPLAKVERGSMRLAIRAVGPTMTVSIDGQEILSVADERFASGLVALGVVTWSGPVTATFENVLVTVPAS